MWTSETELIALRAVTLTACTTAVALLGARVGGVLPFPGPTLGERGRQRARWLARSGLNPWLDVVLRQLGAWMAPLLGARVRAWLDRRLTLAGQPAGWSPETCVACAVLAVAGGVAVGTWFHVALDSALLGLFGGVALASRPVVFVRDAARLRTRSIERSLPVAMDLVSLCVRAGSDFPAALRFVVSEIGAAHAVCRHELRRVEEALAVGRTREQALRELASRVDSQGVRDFVAAVVQAERRGVPLAGSLAAQADTLRRLRSVRAEELAARAGVAMVLPLMLMVSAILILVIGPLVVEGVAL